MHLVVSAAGKAVPMATAWPEAPGNSQHDVLVRGSGVWKAFGDGRVPASLEALAGDHEQVPPEYETDLGPDDVYYTHWQAGGGYGDPLRREPGHVATDLQAGKVSRGGQVRVRGRARRRGRRQRRGDRQAALHPAGGAPGGSSDT